MTKIVSTMTLAEFLEYGATTLVFADDNGDEAQTWYDGKWWTKIEDHEERQYDTLQEALDALMGDGP